MISTHMPPREMSWIIRSKKYPNNPVPVRDEAEARSLIRQYNAVAQGYKARVPWEYGTYIKDEPNTYRRVGP